MRKTTDRKRLSRIITASGAATAIMMKKPGGKGTPRAARPRSMPPSAAAKMLNSTVENSRVPRPN